MDRMYQRYADPFSFLGSYLAAGCFADWVREFIRACNKDTEEKQDNLLLQVWLHKYDGRLSFNQWKESLSAKPERREKPKVAETGSLTLARNLEIANQTLTKLGAGRR